MDLAFAVCFLVLVYLGLQSFRAAAGVAQEAVGSMVEFMHSLLPMLSTLLVAVGGVTSAAVFHPLLWALVSLTASLVQRLLLPLILLSTAFSLVSHFSSELAFPKSAACSGKPSSPSSVLCSSSSPGSWWCGEPWLPSPTEFHCALPKYLTKTFIPIAGSMFADTLEVVVGGSLLIKNAVGVFGLVMILCLVAAPLIKVLAMVFVYKVVGALLQPPLRQTGGADPGNHGKFPGAGDDRPGHSGSHVLSGRNGFGWHRQFSGLHEVKRMYWKQWLQTLLSLVVLLGLLELLLPLRRTGQILQVGVGLEPDAGGPPAHNPALQRRILRGGFGLAEGN